ncbi:hypothetical protein DEO72_LG1g2130 [Vigna unguiculata]|uniref:Uncharacterized protein n=1 Tax=Vigna unguiculata TaxID=3917 RepID=A0A4D6KS00_VIGUN|nr:hypothetical protein DEO72_LG1g2130 [Vigna unguiculata]
MWQCPPFKISQPEQATCHNPPLTKLTSQILPHHHLLHLTHETLTLIFLLSYHNHCSSNASHHDTSFIAPTSIRTALSWEKNEEASCAITIVNEAPVRASISAVPRSHRYFSVAHRALEQQPPCLPE